MFLRESDNNSFNIFSSTRNALLFSDFFINENGYILDYKTKKPNIEKTHCVKTHAEILTSKELKILGVKLYTKKEIEQLEIVNG